MDALAKHLIDKYDLRLSNLELIEIINLCKSARKNTLVKTNRPKKPYTLVFFNLYTREITSELIYHYSRTKAKNELRKKYKSIIFK